MTVFDMAKNYYPRLWDINRMKQLVEAGKISPEQYKEITGEDLK